MEHNINKLRNFDALNSNKENEEQKKTICKFFLSGKCNKGDSCQFSHNLRGELLDVLSPQQLIINEIDDAIKYGNLDAIFYKMLLNNNNEYDKYYNEIHMKFRGIAVMKLKKQSIIKNIIDRISLRNVNLNGVNLKYGYLPFLYHFIIKGFAWNTFEGARNLDEANAISECFLEIINQLQKEKVKDSTQIPKYSASEYDEIIIEACEYVDSELEENMIHTATHYLCDQVVIHIKESFKYVKYRELVKEMGAEKLAEIRKTIDQEEFDTMLSETFDKIILDKNNEDKQPIDLFNERKDNKEATIQKYKDKCQKAIRRAKKQDDIDCAHEKLAYNLKQLDFKLDIFFRSIFNTQMKRKKIIMNEINYEDIFDKCTSKLVGVKNVRFGTPINIPVLIDSLSFIRDNIKNLQHNNEYYINKIIDQIPSDLLNIGVVIDTIKNFKCIDYLWKRLINSVTLETPTSFCINLLNQFFKESNMGLKEAYCCEYLNILFKLVNSVSDENKIKILETLLSSILVDDIKSEIRDNAKM